MSHAKLTLPDDRDEPRTIADPRQLRKQKLKPKQFDLPDDGESEVGGFWTAHIHRSSIISLLAAFLCVLLASFIQQHWPAVGDFGSCLIAFATVSPLVLMTRGWWWRDLAPRYRDMLTLNRRCAGCALDLSSIEPEPDGCTVCPECNAAWRLPNNEQQQQGASHA